MKKMVDILNLFVFAAATVAIAGVFYEGMVLRWFSVVGALFLVMDGSFMLSTLVNLIFCRKSKAILIGSGISLVMIVAALVTKGMGIEHPAPAVTVWFFYIWFYYGLQVSRQLWVRSR